MVKDVYELVLIAPIRRAKNAREVRARARAARVKLARHEKISHLALGLAVDVYDRIAAAEKEEIAKLAEERGWRKAAHPALKG